jgi:pyrophosphatase PpaX
LSPLRAVLFDVDGTLLDTTEFIYGGFDHAIAAHGFPPRGRDEYAATMGKTLDHSYTLLAPGCDPVQLRETHRAWQLGNLHLAVPFPDAAPVLAALRDAGLRQAAITTRSRVTSVRTLELAGLAGYLDLILSFEDVREIKPHPEPLLTALARLDVPPAAALMVGDTDADILAGKAAGGAHAGVTYGFHGRAVAAAGPEYLVDSLTELLALVKPDVRA